MITTDYYLPHLEALKPYFGVQSRIDSRAKAFAFILGVIIGNLLQSGTQHDNPTQSRLFPLSQLLTLAGDDLWPLYDRVMCALNASTKGTRDRVEVVAKEAHHLHASISGRIDLDESATTYFLLYGISVSASVCAHSSRREGVWHA